MDIKTSIKAWFIWGLGATFFLAEYFARVSPSVMIPDLMTTFQANALAIGTMSAFFYFAYIPMQLPVGILVDKFGPHRVLTSMAIICGLACLLFGTSQNVFLAQTSRFTMGFSAAFAFVGTLKLASSWFDSKRFGLLAGMTQALGMLGALIGQAPTAMSVNYMGWRSTMYIMGFAIIVLGLLIAIFVRDTPSRRTPKSDDQATHGVLKGLSLVIKNPHSWINAAYIGFLYAPTAAFAELWGDNFLEQGRHFSMPMAASAIGMIFIGWAMGGPLCGFISDKLKRRKPFMIASPICSMLFMTSLIYLPSLSIFSVFTLLFLYGLTNTGVVLSYAVASEINPKSINGTSIAFANMASVLIGACFQPIIGWILDDLWRGTAERGVATFTIQEYHWALLALPICSIISLLFSFYLKETRCKNIST